MARLATNNGRVQERRRDRPRKPMLITLITLRLQTLAPRPNTTHVSQQSIQIIHASIDCSEILAELQQAGVTQCFHTDHHLVYYFVFDKHDRGPDFGN